MVYDEVIGLDDPHLDACMIAYYAGSAFGAKINPDNLLRRAKPPQDVRKAVNDIVEELRKATSGKEIICERK